MDATFMAAFGVYLIATINCVVLYFASMLFTGGNGTSFVVESVRWWGYIWIGIVSVAALYLCSRGKGDTGVLIALTPLPIAYYVLLAVA
jgi:hypothetical protein